MELTYDQLWEIWNSKFSDEMTLIDFMAVADAINDAMREQ